MRGFGTADGTALDNQPDTGEVFVTSYVSEVAAERAQGAGVAHDEEPVVDVSATSDLDEGGEHPGVEGITVLALR